MNYLHELKNDEKPLDFGEPIVGDEPFEPEELFKFGERGELLLEPLPVPLPVPLAVICCKRLTGLIRGTDKSEPPPELFNVLDVPYAERTDLDCNFSVLFNEFV